MYRQILAFGLAIASTQLLMLAATAEEPKRKDLDLANHEPIASAIGKFDEITLNEGLPREQAASIAELRTKKIVKFHDYPFYAEVLPFAGDDAQAVTKLLAEAKSIDNFHEKFCGGFHPDYCLKWKIGKKSWLALVCLGCGEVKFFGPKQLRLHCDLKKEAFDELKRVLVKYQKNRPQARVDEEKKE